MEEKSFDFLNILTKFEIIDFLKKKYFLTPPSEREVKFFKWYKNDKILNEKITEYLLNKKSIEYVKEVDRLAVMFNNEKDIEKKLLLLKKRENYIELVKKENEEYSRLEKERDENYKLIGD